MLFLDFFALPEGGANVSGQPPSIKNAVLFGTFESSIGMVRSLDEVTRTSLKEVREFTASGPPVRHHYHGCEWGTVVHALADRPLLPSDAGLMGSV